MARTELSERQPRLEGQRVLVVGLGRSGLAAARLASARGARVTVSDNRPEAELGERAAEVRRLGAEVRAGAQQPELVGGIDLVVVSPGVPLDVPLILEARSRGITVWGEVELAWRFCRGRVIGITGSNGKSTVTAMAGAMLRAAGVAGGTGGNLGVPLSDLLAQDSEQAVHAVELSSFQLEAIEVFRPAVAVVTNLSPDHLDRYAGFEQYVQAKARLLRAQQPADFAVLNADDPQRERLLGSVRGRLLQFSTGPGLESGAFVRDGALRLLTDEGAERVLEVAELSLPGEHNLANALAAALACRLVGCPVRAIATALRSFRALPHRLEHVATVGGVRFFDDSKATNLESAARALQAFPAETVHLILGGRDKGADWATLIPAVRRHARQVLLVGEAATAIRDALRGSVPLSDWVTVPQAVRAAFREANTGDVVLLAPGCASFDQYRNFEERGDDFQREVRRLTEEYGDA